MSLRQQAEDWLAFFDLFPSKEGLRLRLAIPDTAIIKDARIAGWFSTNAEGVVCRTPPKSISKEAVVQRFSSLAVNDPVANPGGYVAVAHYNSGAARVLQRTEFRDLVNSLQSVDDDTAPRASSHEAGNGRAELPFCIQQYVPPSNDVRYIATYAGTTDVTCNTFARKYSTRYPPVPEDPAEAAASLRSAPQMHPPPTLVDSDADVASRSSDAQTAGQQAGQRQAVSPAGGSRAGGTAAGLNTGSTPPQPTSGAATGSSSSSGGGAGCHSVSSGWEAVAADLAGPSGGGAADVMPSASKRVKADVWRAVQDIMTFLDRVHHKRIQGFVAEFIQSLEGHVLFTGVHAAQLSDMRRAPAATAASSSSSSPRSRLSKSGRPPALVVVAPEDDAFEATIPFPQQRRLSQRAVSPTAPAVADGTPPPLALQQLLWPQGLRSPAVAPSGTACGTAGRTQGAAGSGSLRMTERGSSAASASGSPVGVSMRSAGGSGMQRVSSAPSMRMLLQLPLSGGDMHGEPRGGGSAARTRSSSLAPHNGGGYTMSPVAERGGGGGTPLSPSGRSARGGYAGGGVAAARLQAQAAGLRPGSAPEAAAVPPPPPLIDPHLLKATNRHYDIQSMSPTPRRGPVAAVAAPSDAWEDLPGSPGAEGFGGTGACGSRAMAGESVVSSLALELESTRGRLAKQTENAERAKAELAELAVTSQSSRVHLVESLAEMRVELEAAEVARRQYEKEAVVLREDQVVLAERLVAAEQETARLREELDRDRETLSTTLRLGQDRQEAIEAELVRLRNENDDINRQLTLTSRRLEEEHEVVEAVRAQLFDYKTMVEGMHAQLRRERKMAKAASADAQFRRDATHAPSTPTATSEGRSTSSGRDDRVGGGGGAATGKHQRFVKSARPGK